MEGKRKWLSLSTKSVSPSVAIRPVIFLMCGVRSAFCQRFDGSNRTILGSEMGTMADRFPSWRNFRRVPSSPSPVRPPNQRIRLDEVGSGSSKNADQTQEDLLDPGDGQPHDLSDSGDWGDSLDDLQGVDEKIDVSQAVEQKSSSVDQDSGDPRVLG